MTTWVEALADHEQLLIGLATLSGIAAMALAYALMVVRRGGRSGGRPGAPQPRR
jgi:hypothetical protein